MQAVDNSIKVSGERPCSVVVQQFVRQAHDILPNDIEKPLEMLVSDVAVIVCVTHSDLLLFGPAGNTNYVLESGNSEICRGQVVVIAYAPRREDNHFGNSSESDTCLLCHTPGY